MLFDHDAEIGAFLFLNMKRDPKPNGTEKIPMGEDEKGTPLFKEIQVFSYSPKIEGFLYRKDEIKETQDFDREDPKNPLKRLKGKEDVIVQTDWYIMDCQGNWFNIKESTNPFIFHLPYFIDKGMAEDKAKIAWAILKDWIMNLAGGEVDIYTPTIPYIEPEGLTDDAIAELYLKHKIDYDLMFKSAEWIQSALDPVTDEEKKDEKFDPVKKLLRELDKFEYDIGDKK